MADIFGTPGDDVLNGTPLDDTITTYEGNDTVTADAGDDLIIVDKSSTGSIDGGAGYDIVRVFSDVGLAPYWSFNVNQTELTTMNTTAGVVTLSGVEQLEIIDTATNNYFTYAQVGSAVADTIDISSIIMNPYQNAVILAGNGDDILTGSLNSGTDFHAGNGNDIATGGNENDRFFGGQGADTYDGSGNTGISGDVIYFLHSSTGVAVNLETGIGTAGDALGDTYINIEDVQGSQGDDVLIGNGSNNRLTSNGGNDILDGGTGDDILTFNSVGYVTMTGGAGADLFYTNSVEAITSEITDFDADDTIDFRSSGNANGLVIPTLIGTASFSGVIGEVRYEKTGGETLVHIDIDGDAAADETLTISNGEFDLAATSSTSQGLRLSMASIVTGTSGNDTLIGTTGDDIINALAGDDTITTHSGNDTVDAGTGDDIIIGDALGGGSINGGDGVDVFRINYTEINIFGLVYSSVPDGPTPSYFYSTQAGSYNISGVERSEFYNSDFSVLEALLFLGTAGDDVLDQSTETVAVSAIGGDGDDTITGGTGMNGLAGHNGNDTLIGGDGNDILAGGAGEDSLFGNGGFNRLYGGADYDYLEGGNGNTWFYGGEGADNLIGGSGYDVIWYDDSSVGVTVNLTTGEAAGGTAEGDAYSLIEGIVGSYYADTLSGDEGDNNISARSGDDIVMTFGGNDSISGEDGDDIIDAGAGDDYIYGNLGNDTLTGGSGADQFFFNQLGGAFTSTITDFEQGDSLAIYDDYTVAGDDLPTFIGTDAFTNTPWEIRYEASSGQTNLYMDIDGDGVTDETLTLSNGEFVLDSTQVYRLDIFITNTIYGTSGDDDFYGTFGDDVIDGLAGNDTFYLSPGADTYDGNDGNDTVDYGSAEGGVTASLATGQGTGGEAFGDSYISIENLRGSDLADTLTGDTNVNLLVGEGGNDYLRAGAGDDTLDGGFGADFLRGGAGADNLLGGAGQDWADYSTSPLGVTIDLAAGTASGGHADGDTLSLIERVLGSTKDDTITGDNGVNYLRGWSGDDILIGGAGNDYLQGDAGADALDGGAGINDWAYYASATSGLTVNMSDTSLNTGEAIGDTYVNIENLTGSRHNDNLTGDSSNNQIRGYLGDDMLYGGDGRDFLRGDQGADVHDGGDGLDWAYYVANSAAITIDLGANTASGGEATGDTFFNVERVFGSRFDDSITGDSGANYLRGYLGDDTLTGEDGNDFLQGDSGADILDGGAGSDWVYYYSSTATDGITINLADANQNTGEAAGDSYISIENVVGSQFNDVIIGDSGDNYLRGAQGDDIIIGGAGDDIMRGEAGADIFVFNFGTGTDTVIDYNDAEDMLDFSAFSGGGDINPADYAAEVNGDVVITIGTDVITIENTTIAEIMDNIIL